MPEKPSVGLPVKSPVECRCKAEVRAEIDRLDRVLISLFAERHAYVARMADLKQDPHEAFDPERIEKVIGQVRRRAAQVNLDEDQAELLWRTLIDWNVNFEKGIIAAHRATDK